MLGVDRNDVDLENCIFKSGFKKTWLRSAGPQVVSSIANRFY